LKEFVGTNFESITSYLEFMKIKKSGK